MEMAQPARKRKLRPATRAPERPWMTHVVVGMVALAILGPYLLTFGRHAPWWEMMLVAAAAFGFGRGIAWLMQRGGPITWLRIVKWAGLTALAGLAVAFATAAIIITMYARGLPSISKLSDYKPTQVTVILDDKDRRIGEICGDKPACDTRRTFVPFDHIPKQVYQAFIAAEDERFWSHGGVDYMGIVRAALHDLRGGRKQGASTITQQVVKNMILTPERTFKRKIQEMILARRLEQHLTKQEILTIYLNEIYLGHQRYGIQEAARFYFGKDVDQLDAGEAAMLAALPKGPERYSPLNNPTLAKQRQTYVLNREAALGMISQADAKKFIDAPIRVVKNPFPRLGSAPEWVEKAREELTATYGKDQLATLGAKVKTTLDSDLQAAAQKALVDGLRAYDDRHHLGKAIHTYKPDRKKGWTPRLEQLARQLPKHGPKAGHVYKALVLGARDRENEVDVDLGNWPAVLVLGGPADDRFNPPDAHGKTRPASQRFKPGDLIQVVPSHQKPKLGGHAVELPPAPEGAVVVIETRTRKVRALVGGYALRAGDFDRATTAKRQPGSSFKPFVYAAAIDQGKATAASVVNDAPEVYDLWKPQNYEKEFEGPVRLRVALAKSINTVAIRVCADVTPQVVADYAHKLGIQSDLPQELSLSLGSGEVTPLEMTNAYTTFAAGGMYAPPRFVDSIDGKEPPVTPPVQALRPEVAYVVTDMMRSVVEEGTGVRVKKLGIPVAGKTGTSNDLHDAWFIGMTPDYVVGVWVGFDQPRSLGGHEQGGVTAAPIYLETMQAMHPVAKQFPRPPGVTEAVIDKATGLLASPDAPADSKMTEVFVTGTQPTEVAPLPGQATVDTFVTGAYDDGPSAGSGSGSGSGSDEGIDDSGEDEPDTDTPPGSGSGGAEPRKHP